MEISLREASSLSNLPNTVRHSFLPNAQSVMMNTLCVSVKHDKSKDGISERVYTRGMNTETLGQRIKRLRIAAKLSQIELARRCGWSTQSRVGNYEQDNREPNLADLQLIASAVGVELADLLPSADRHHLAEAKGSYKIAPELAKFQAQLHDLAAEGPIPPVARTAIEAVLNLAAAAAIPKRPAWEDSDFGMDEETEHDQTTPAPYDRLVKQLVKELNSAGEVPADVEKASAVVIDFFKHKSGTG